jgi:hypothetical protein
MIGYSSDARHRIFSRDRDQRQFLEFLRGSAERFDVVVHSFVLMATPTGGYAYGKS